MISLEILLTTPNSALVSGENGKSLALGVVLLKRLRGIESLPSSLESTSSWFFSSYSPKLLKIGLFENFNFQVFNFKIDILNVQYAIYSC